MRYSEIRPAASLARYIECFWTLEDDMHDTPVAQSAPERVLPDGCLEVVLNFGSPFVEHGPGGPTIQPRFFVVGQTDRPTWIAVAGRADVLGVRFHPAGAFHFLRTAVHELTGSTVPLSDLFDRVDRSCFQRLCESRGTVDRIQAFETLFWTRTRQRDDADVSVDGSVRALLRADGAVRVRDLAHAAGLSPRQLERRFRERVGIGPKLLGRILRFHRVLRAFDTDAGWAEAAAESGYYDQSHLIRDFHQFAGECPSAITRWEPLTLSFLRKNRMSHFSKTPGAALP